MPVCDCRYCNFLEAYVLFGKRRHYATHVPYRILFFRKMFYSDGFYFATFLFSKRTLRNLWNPFLRKSFETTEVVDHAFLILSCSNIRNSIYITNWKMVTQLRLLDFSVSLVAFFSALMTDQCTSSQWINWHTSWIKCELAIIRTTPITIILLWIHRQNLCVIELILPLRHGRTIFYFLPSEVNYLANSDVS